MGVDEGVVLRIGGLAFVAGVSFQRTQSGTKLAAGFTGDHEGRFTRGAATKPTAADQSQPPA